MTREEIDWVNQNVSLNSLVQEYYGVELHVGFTLCCPFHPDSRKSAKAFPDNCMFCFTERKHFRPYNVLQLNGFTDDKIRQVYSVPTDLKPRAAWSPPPQYEQAVRQLRDKQYTVEEVMRAWDFIVGVMEEDRLKGAAPNV